MEPLTLVVAPTNLTRQPSEVTTIGDEQTPLCPTEKSAESILHDEIEGLQQDHLDIFAYIERGDDLFKRAPAEWEVYVAQSFVAGLADEEHRDLVAGILEKDGFTWERAREVVRCMAFRGRRRRERRFIVPLEELEGYVDVTP